MKSVTLLALAVLALVVSPAAIASPIVSSAPTILSGHYQFTVSGFPADSPVSEVTGSFRFHGYRRGYRYTDYSTIITNFVISIPLDPRQYVMMSSQPSARLGDVVWIGANVCGATAVCYGQNDFILTLLDFDTAAHGPELKYSPRGPITTPIYRSTRGSVSGYTVDAPAGLSAAGCILLLLLRRLHPRARGL